MNCGRQKSHPGINSSVFRLDELKDVKITLVLSTITQAEHLTLRVTEQMTGSVLLHT